MTEPFIRFPIRFAIAVFTTLNCGAAIADDAERIIRDLELQLDRAVVAGDVATFDRLFANDFSHGSQSGRFRTKAEWMKGKEQGKSAYETFESTGV